MRNTMMHGILSLLLLAGTAELLTKAKGVYSSEDHQRLRKLLFKNYDRSVRPVRNASKTTKVEMQFFVAQVLDVDERLQTFKINAWLTMRWLDEYLQWNPANYSGLRNFKISKDSVWMPDLWLYNKWYDEYLTWIPANYNNLRNFKISKERVWMPDLWLYNNAGSRYEDYTANSICSVYYDGKVLWQSPTIIKTHCPMDVTNFPFDYQKCNITFGPWQHGADEILLTGTGSGEKYLRNSGEWNITGFDTDNGKQPYEIYADDEPVLYSSVTYSVGLRRIPNYFVFYLIMPCFLISATTFLSFFLPAESGEKVSLGITVLLSLTVFLLLVSELLPPTGAVPVIGVYYASTMVMVSLSLTMSVVVLNLHHRGPEANQVPTWLRRLVAGPIGRIVLWRSTVKVPPRHTYRMRKRLNGVNSYELEPLDACNGWDEKRDGPLPSVAELDTRKQLNSMKQTSSTRIKEISILQGIHDEFRYMRDVTTEKEKDERCQNDWKKVALVVDRIFMFLYLIGMLCTVFIIISQTLRSKRFDPHMTDN